MQCTGCVTEPAKVQERRRFVNSGRKEQSLCLCLRERPVGPAGKESRGVRHCTIKADHTKGDHIRRPGLIPHHGSRESRIWSMHSAGGWASHPVARGGKTHDAATGSDQVVVAMVEDAPRTAQTSGVMTASQRGYSGCDRWHALCCKAARRLKPSEAHHSPGVVSDRPRLPAGSTGDLRSSYRRDCLVCLSGKLGRFAGMCA